MASTANSVVFARSPAGLNEELLDYSKSDDVKIYQSAIAPMTPLYDGEPGGLLTFLERLIIRADLSNWKNIIMTPDSSGVLRNLLTEHGRLTMANIRTYSETYNGHRGRKEQNSAQMHACLAQSLTESVLSKLKSQSAVFRIGPDKLADGPCYLKLIIQSCTIEGRSTVAAIRDALGSLPAYMAKVGCDIGKFNDYVREQRDSLLQRGEESQDILNNLFKAYLTVREPTFNEYIRMQNMHYVDGKNFDVDQLMDVAEHWYKLLVRDNNWKPSKEANNCIVALTAEIASIGRGNNSERYKVDKKKKVEKANKGKGKKEESNTSDNWKSTAPKEGATHTKTVGKRTFTWCPHHKYWGGHAAAEYFKVNKKPSTTPSTKTPAQKEAILQLKAAYASMLEDLETQE
jgi:hypothetical protein